MARAIVELMRAGLWGVIFAVLLALPANAAAPEKAQTASQKAGQTTVKARAKASKTKAGKAKAKRTAKKKSRKSLPAAKKLFGAKRVAAALPARAIGFYTHGCLAGGMELPATGPAWQAMRLSRNRNWGHPALVKLVARLAVDAKAVDGWNGLLVGDLAQPRGGPMLSGHSSHQVGLDADIWLREMPDRVLTRRHREKFQPISMLKNSLDVNPKVWTDKHLKLIKRAALFPQVERIFVHRAIKYKLCQSTVKGERAWLSKVRPWAGHHYHMHVRIKCPAGSIGCKAQRPPLATDGCKYIEKWHRKRKAWLERPKKKRVKKKKKVAKKKKRTRKRRYMTMKALPRDCQLVLDAVDLKPVKPPQLVAAPQQIPPQSNSTGLAEARSIMRPGQ